MDYPDIATTEIISGIGKRIRAIRIKLGMSLQDIAQKTGFTKSYLSQIENAKREPPISTLSKIAYVLNVDFSYLISGEKADLATPDLIIVRKGQGKAGPGPHAGSGYFYESLAWQKRDRLMDGYLVTIGNEFPPQAYTHEGQELAYVIEGTQEFVYDGKTHIINEGDCFVFNSNRPHNSRTLGHKPGKILVVFAVSKPTLPSGQPENKQG